MLKNFMKLRWPLVFQLNFFLYGMINTSIEKNTFVKELDNQLHFPHLVGSIYNLTVKK